MSNRCGHNPAALRLCDTVKRGKGGQPRVLGIISGYLTDAAYQRRRLKAWHYHNDTQRGRRSESREAGIAVLQFLTANWLQLETRRCAMPGTEFLECPDVNYLARAISRSPAWEGSRLSPRRVTAALEAFVAAGYISRSKQKRDQLANGTWISAPKIITFTKRFFLDLGGKRLWKQVFKAGQVKLAKIRDLVRRLPTLAPPDRALREYLNPGEIVSPRRARWIRRIRPPDWESDRPHLPARHSAPGTA